MNLLNRQGKYNRYESGEQSVYINILQSYVHGTHIPSSSPSAMWSVRDLDLVCFMPFNNPAEKSGVGVIYFTVSRDTCEFAT